MVVSGGAGGAEAFDHVVDGAWVVAGGEGDLRDVDVLEAGGALA